MNARPLALHVTSFRCGGGRGFNPAFPPFIFFLGTNTLHRRAKYVRKPYVPTQPGPYASDLIARGLISPESDRAVHEWKEDWNERLFDAKRLRPKVTYLSWSAWDAVYGFVSSRIAATDKHPEQNPLSADTRKALRSLLVAMRRDLDRTRPF
jgi:hypothetical protein